jgi:lipoate-protein ligase A
MSMSQEWISAGAVIQRASLWARRVSLIDVQLIRADEAQHPALEVATSHALLLRVAARELPATLRVYRPAPTVAFGRLDRLRAGFGHAVGAARAQGFDPVLRSPGGHAAAYDRGSVGFDLVVPTEELFAGVQDVFRRSSSALAAELGRLGVEAGVGPVPREYCPGDYTVNARGRVKLVGTAQRAIRGASLLGGFVTVSGAERLRAVLAPVYAALELDWDPHSLGAVADEAAGMEPDQVAAAVVRALAPGAPEAALDAETRALAEGLEPDHALTR